MKIIIERSYEKALGWPTSISSVINVGEFAPFKKPCKDWINVCEFDAVDNPVGDPEFFIGNIYYSQKKDVWWYTQYFKGSLQRAQVMCIDPIAEFITCVAYNDFRKHFATDHSSVGWNYECTMVGSRIFRYVCDVHGKYYAVMCNAELAPVYLGKYPRMHTDMAQLRYLVKTYCLK